MKQMPKRVTFFGEILWDLFLYISAKIKRYKKQRYYRKKYGS